MMLGVQAVRFDAQADSFDRRAGLPPGVAARIAAALTELAGDEAAGPWLEWGAGTGEIGAALAERAVSYVGLDASGAMLAVFQDRLRGLRRSAPLVRADADRPWPIGSGRVRAFFASRAAHHFDERRFVPEVVRCAHAAGAVFVLGGVRRDPSGVRETLRRALSASLAERQVASRSSERTRARLLEAFERLGAERLGARTAAEWTVSERPSDSLSAWRGKPGLAGATLDADLQREVLDRLEEWARGRYGDLETARESVETYELDAVRWAAAGRRPASRS